MIYIRGDVRPMPHNKPVFLLQIGQGGIHMKIAAAYIRVSTDGQLEYSPAN